MADEIFWTYNTPTQSLVQVNVTILVENDDKKPQIKLPPVEISNTGLLPTVSARKPQICELSTIPAYPHELKIPCSIVEMRISHSM